MFVLDDLLLMAALGAGSGALFNKKDPLKGALMGGVLGGIGGAALPGLLGAGGATAGTAAATEGATAGGLLAADTGLNAAGYLAPEMGGLLGGGEAAASGAAGSEMAAGGMLNSGGYLAPEMTGTIAEQAPAEVVDMSSKAGMFDKLNYQTNGLLGNATDAYSKFGKPAGQVMNAVQLGRQMAGNEPQVQAPPPPSMTRAPMNLNETIGLGQQQRMYDAQDAERRKQLMAMYANNIGRVG